MHIVLALAFLLVAGLLSLAMKRDPNKWYGDMLCLSCGYKWVARKRTPPARCPGCSRRYLHVVTGNSPRPIVPATPQTPSYHNHTSTAAPQSWTENLDAHEQSKRHQRLENLLANPGITTSQKAFYVVALTRNADAVNLMHRLKVTEAESQVLLEQLEQSKFVSAPDDMGERVVLVDLNSDLEPSWIGDHSD